MIWEKKGKIFSNLNNVDYLDTHASNPLPILIKNDIYRIFFSGRDKFNKSSVGYFDFDLVENKLISVCDRVIFRYGDSSSFYSHGVSIGNLYKQNTRRYILFMGWNFPNNGHWRGDIGKLELTKNSSELILDSEKPFMGIDLEDEISLSYPFVIFHEGIYKMWYGTTISWSSENEEMIHVIKYATSIDGKVWKKNGIAIPYEIGVAQAFSRPTIIINEQGYHMWYSYRSGSGEKYRIGYSQSDDGITWKRKHEQVGIDISENDWDSEMICYPFVIEHKKKLYMFYNGNEYGKYGIGLAVNKE
jgi:hypothetical protein